MRRIVFSEFAGYNLIGTYHEPHMFESSRSSIGVFITNFGWAPRDGHGSFGTVLADDFAAAGFPAFRIDLPGIGDSAGSVPDIAENYGDGVRRGEQVPAFSAAIKSLMAKYSLTKAIVGGICAPFINAVFSWGEKRIPLDGIIALDADFVGPKLSLENKIKPSKKSYSLIKRLVHIKAGNKQIKDFVPTLWRRMAWTILFLRNYPDNTNIPLVRIWKNLVSSGIPVLMICAKDKTQYLYINRVNKIALRGVDNSCVRFFAIPGTDHAFMTGDPRETILREVRQWRDFYFPK